MTPQELAIGGGTLAVDIAGTGPLVVCSPAMGDERSAFAPLAERLVAAGFRVATVDLRGHGDSSAACDAYGDEPTAEDLIAVIEWAGGGSAILAGASMSAAAAVIAASRRPDLVTGLVLLGPFLRGGGGALAAIMQALLLRPWGPAIWRLYSRRLWPGLGADAARERAAALTRRATRPGRWRAFRATVAGADHRVVEPWIDGVLAPVLVVMGEADPDWKDPAAEAAWVASRLGDSAVVHVPEAGHAPMLERPDLVAEPVIAFARRLTAPADEAGGTIEAGGAPEIPDAIEAAEAPGTPEASDA